MGETTTAHIGRRRRYRENITKTIWWRFSLAAARLTNLRLVNPAQGSCRRRRRSVYRSLLSFTILSLSLSLDTAAFGGIPAGLTRVARASPSAATVAPRHVLCSPLIGRRRRFFSFSPAGVGGGGPRGVRRLLRATSEATLKKYVLAPIRELCNCYYYLFWSTFFPSNRRTSLMKPCYTEKSIAFPHNSRTKIKCSQINTQAPLRGSGGGGVLF